MGINLRYTPPKRSESITMQKRITYLFNICDDVVLEIVKPSTLSNFLTIKQEVFGGSRLKRFFEIFNFYFERLTSEDTIHMLVKVNFRVVGIVTLDFDYTSVTIHNVAISEEHRKNGYGTQMLEVALNLAYRRGIRFAKLYVSSENKVAYSMYYKLGFRPERPKY